MVDNNQHSLIDGISNYIRMNNSGALMITGNWGCGKTFFIKNTVDEPNTVPKNGITNPVNTFIFSLSIGDLGTC